MLRHFHWSGKSGIRLKICFRVDAGNKIGMGHLMESLALAGSLKKKITEEIVFIANSPAIKIIEKNGHKAVKINDQINEKEEVSFIKDILRKSGCQCLIINLPGKDSSFFNKLESGAEKTAVILDDAEHRPIKADIVVNYSITQEEKYYLSLPQSKTLYYIGPKYALQPEILHKSWKQEKYIPDQCRAILLNQGGSDPFGLTIRIIKELELLNLKQVIYILTGQEMLPKHKNEIEKTKPFLKNNYRFMDSITQEKVYELMAECDLAITAAGNTLYELAVFGVPSITVCHHELHNKVAGKFAERKAVINLGEGLKLRDGIIAKTVHNLINSKEERIFLNGNIKRIADGLGSKRVAERILEC
ncbi:MAG: Pseudaminic acid biosynthesis-associated protein PseG [Desulfotomaculum sp. 46_296]|nr:MAG: Pseudaminic acid biosynthesis-associated protein PseG [Desulfotomaculum sp. 46_296]